MLTELKKAVCQANLDLVSEARQPVRQGQPQHSGAHNAGLHAARSPAASAT